MPNDWHSQNIEEVFGVLGVSGDGLTDSEAQKRLRMHGLNKLAEARPPSRLKIFLRQFKSAFVYILLAAFLVSIFLTEYTDAAVIFAAIFLNAVIGFIQENRANQALAALKKMIEHKARVIRDGREKVIDANELVPGDVIILQAGDKIPADARLLEIYDLETNEAALTGESVPVEKNIEPLAPGAILAERKNMVFMGTVVARGRGRAVVVETGMHTQMGEIAKLVAETHEEATPLEIQIKKLASSLTIIILIVSLFVFLEGLLTGKDFYEMFLTAIATAVASVPEGLLISMVVILAIGMQKLVKEKALVRHLLAAETLGSVSVICVDKTGTLTEGEMQVEQIWCAGELVAREQFYHHLKNGQANLLKTLEIILLSNDAVIENPQAPLEEWKILGDPTQRALLLAGVEAGLRPDELLVSQPKFDEAPFDSIRKYAVTAHHLNQKQDALYVRGAPERILARSVYIECNGQKTTLREKEQKEILVKVEEFAGQGFRVVAVGYKNISCDHHCLDNEQKAVEGLVFAALILLRDPLRANTKETIALARQAGVRTVMITGDHPSTAVAIGQELGLFTDKADILTGVELDAISDAEFEKQVERINIYARVSPAHKSRIVDAWQKKGAVVAMTGDGVNDAPALKSADIGLAVGSGTDVAKEAADVVLLDNNFKTIVKAIEGGRIIFDNLRKVVVYLLSDNFHELAIVALSLLFGLPLPILPAQILWINLAEDSLPSMALAFDAGDRRVLSDAPGPRHGRIIERPHKRLIFAVGVTTVFIMFGLYVWLLITTGNLEYSRTMTFSGLSISSLLYIYSCRSLRENIWDSGLFGNHFLNWSVIFGLAFITAAVYLPLLQTVLHTVSLTLSDWLLLFGLSVINVLLVEFLKWALILRRRAAMMSA